VTVNQAVRALRKHVGKTQQIFATELGISISSLNNYERQRIPEPKQLIAFEGTALKAGRADLAMVFLKALGAALGWFDWHSELALKLLKLDPNNPKNWYELACLEALERCLSGAAGYQDLAPTVMSALALVIEREAELEVRGGRGTRRWERFSEESVLRGYADKIGDQVKWPPFKGRKNQL
jgi:transcriptional regulator with XRE-family HTH domain